jgi:hypothetical protein
MPRREAGQVDLRVDFREELGLGKEAHELAGGASEDAIELPLARHKRSRTRPGRTIALGQRGDEGMLRDAERIARRQVE